MRNLVEGMGGRNEFHQPVLTDKLRMQIVIDNLDGWYIMALKKAELVSTPEQEKCFQQDIDTLREILGRMP